MNPQPKPIIRERTPQDIPLAAETLLDVYRTNKYPVEGVDAHSAIHWCTPTDMLQAWVGCLADTIVGQATLTTAPPAKAMIQSYLSAHPASQHTDIVVLARLWVRESGRGRGVGAALTRAAVEWARERGKRVVLNVIEKDGNAMRMYEGLGFGVFGRGVYTAGDGSRWGEVYYAGPPP